MFVSPFRSLLSSVNIARAPILACRPPPAIRALHLPPRPRAPPSPALSPFFSLFRSRFARTPPADTRAFSLTSLLRGPRPYYRGGSSSRYGGGGGRGWRYKIDSLNPSVVLYSLIAANVGVFLMWQYGQRVLQQFRDPSYLRWMTNNFTCSWRNFQSGRVWTLVTCCFSHEGTGHILMNLLSLYFMAPPVMMMLGNVGFLSLYLFAGVVSSATSMLFAQLNNQQRYYQSHGASGAIYGTLAFFAAAHPRTTFLLFFVVPVPAWLCVGGILAWDVYGSLYRRGGTTDSAGHVGGVLAGLLWFLKKAGRLG